MLIDFWQKVANIAEKMHELNTIYIHNMNFDAQFMQAELHKLFEIKVIVKDSKFKKIACYRDGKLLFQIHCSFNKTGASLRSLAEALQVQTQKGHWPHNFITPDQINYVGPWPEGPRILL